MTKKYRIVLDRKGCIGVASCVGAFPEYWSINEADEQKADLKDAKKDKDGNQELIIDLDEKQLEAHKHVAEVCPVNVIHIFDAETNERII